MKDKETRKREAQERLSEYKSLTNTQKVLKLDLKLGGGNGAVRQRAKLAQESVKESEGRVPKAEKQPKAKPVFASKAEERKWEYHQKQKSKQS
jgi:hypothetical protein